MQYEHKLHNYVHIFIAPTDYTSVVLPMGIGEVFWSKRTRHWILHKKNFSIV